MISSLQDIKQASREELVTYLTGWGFQCYDHEKTEALRRAAIENFKTEKG